MRLIIKNVNMFNSLTGMMEANRNVVIEGKNIMSTDAQYELHDGDDIVDGTGKYLIPGLFDLHVHIDAGPEAIKAMESFMMRNKDAQYAYNALKNAQNYIRAGVTTIRDCGSFNAGHPSVLREIFNSNLFYGPRLLVAQNTIGQYGNQEKFGPEIKDDEPTKSGVDGIIYEVRKRKRDGNDFIKTMTTGGVLHGKASVIEQSLFRDEELEMMVSEAERLGMHVAAHAHNAKGILAAVKAGIRTIEHGTLINKEIADLMVEKGTFLVPTQSAGNFIKFASEQQLAMLPEEVKKRWTMVANEMNKNHKIAYDAGVQIAVGTDAPVAGHHPHTAKELELLMESLGMSSAKVLQAATIVSAKAIRQDHITGSLEPGKLADMVLLDENPIDNIKILQDNSNIKLVIKDGIKMSKEGNLLHN